MQNSRRKIFKISTERLASNNWDIKLDQKLAVRLDELVDLFDNQSFRLLDIISKAYKSNLTDKVLAVEISKKKDYARATSPKGIYVNGFNFQWFVGTTGGLKNETILFVRSDLLGELDKRCECGRKKDYKLVPAKYEAYKSLTCSASLEIVEPRDVLVVSDCFVDFYDSVINIDDTNNDEPEVTILENILLKNNGSDGLNLCTPEYMQRVAEKLKLDYIPAGGCLRNAWLKGMLYVFDILDFAEKIAHTYEVKDIWGHIHDIRNVDMIITESSLKIWDNYDSWEDYHSNYIKNGYRFAMTKVTPKVLDDVREINYQYLQSYELTDEDIKELAKPTVDWLKQSLTGDYEQTLKFLGISEKTKSNDYAQALYLNPEMMKDPYVIDRINKMIKKKINNAKIGKLLVNGNYQLVSGDPYALMQHVFGLEVTGLLEAKEVYSKYWNDKEDAEELVCFRSPMTSHNNIRKMKRINNDTVNYWYRHMDTIFIINNKDTFCMAMNGCDFDGDAIYSTNNKVLLRKYVELLAIQCVQRKAQKQIVTRSMIKKSNYKGLGNGVGKITNDVSSMIDILFGLQKGTIEYETLYKRILCGQLFQQNELDKLKGIIAKDMPKNWYMKNHCQTELDLAIVADKKPYYFMYNYPVIKRVYDDYIKHTREKCLMIYGCTVEELKNKENLTKEEEEFLYWYNVQMPVNCSPSTMNRLCWYIESEFNGYVTQLKNQNFDYTFLKNNKVVRYPKAKKEEIEKLEKEYVRRIKNFKIIAKENNLSAEEANKKTEALQQEFRDEAIKICSNKWQLMNIVLDLCYGKNKNKYFCWAVIGDLIIEKLKEDGEKENE
ncbi:MAG: RNA dependent RNA polymerase [Bacteriophage sp.]|nr:MAG: RNA dependent RNA polymerase [Bacteriophage sp.]